MQYILSLDCPNRFENHNFIKYKITVPLEVYYYNFSTLGFYSFYFLVFLFILVVLFPNSVSSNCLNSISFNKGYEGNLINIFVDKTPSHSISTYPSFNLII